MVSEFDTRRKVIVSALNELKGVSCIDPAGAFYAFPNISDTGLTSSQAQDLFLDEAGVATIAGTSFGQFGEGYLRFSYANSTENILRAIERIDKIIT
jgi:aspartate/methionine/tyrosine aminotransferase